MKCLDCQKLITHNKHVGCCQINGTVSLGGCEHWEPMDDMKSFGTSRDMRIMYPIHDFGKNVGTYGQLEKVLEECEEVRSAVIVESSERIIEECCDLIQATFNMIEILEPGGVQNALELHTQKMVDRGYPVKYYIEMEGKK